MTEATVNCVNDRQVGDAPPIGTAIVRPLRHVRCTRASRPPVRRPGRGRRVAYGSCVGMGQCRLA